jgi:ATP-dependent Clp protease ATP-binding subunit ClpC
MFERYTEEARRALFFARYEASQFGSLAIDTEHLLLGLARMRRGVSGRLLASAGLSYEHVVREVDSRIVRREKVATSVEIPFSPAVKRILNGAMKEADRLEHKWIGAEHLLLALASEPDSVGGRILGGHHLHADAVREPIRAMTEAEHVEPVVRYDPADHLKRIDRVHELVAKLARMKPDDFPNVDLERHLVLESIDEELNALRKILER